MSKKFDKKGLFKRFKDKVELEFKDAVHLFIADVGLPTVIDNYKALREGWAVKRSRGEVPRAARTGGTKLLNELKEMLKMQYPEEYIERFGLMKQTTSRQRKKQNEATTSMEVRQDNSREESKGEGEGDSHMDIVATESEGEAEDESAPIIQGNVSQPVVSILAKGAEVSQPPPQIAVVPEHASIPEVIKRQCHVQSAVFEGIEIVGPCDLAAKMKESFWALFERSPQQAVNAFKEMYVDITRTLKKEHTQGTGYIALDNAYRVGSLQGGRHTEQQTDIMMFPSSQPAMNLQRTGFSVTSVQVQTEGIEVGDSQKKKVQFSANLTSFRQLEEIKDSEVQQELSVGIENERQDFNQFKLAPEGTAERLYYDYQQQIDISGAETTFKVAPDLGAERRLRFASIMRLIAFMRLTKDRLLCELKYFFDVHYVNSIRACKKFGDAFCGSGHTLVQVANAFYCRAVGIENSQLALIVSGVLSSRQLKVGAQCSIYCGDIIRNCQSLIGTSDENICTHILSMDFDQQPQIRTELYKMIGWYRYKILFTSRSPIEAHQEGLKRSLFLRKIPVCDEKRVTTLYAYTSLPLDSSEASKLIKNDDPLLVRESNVSVCRLFIKYLIADTSNWAILQWPAFYERYVASRLIGTGKVIPTPDVMIQAAKTVAKYLHEYVTLTVQGDKEFICKKKQLTKEVTLPIELQHKAF